MQKFKHHNREYELRITWWQAIEVFPQQFNLNITKLVGDMEKTTETLQLLLLNDDLMVSLMWYYIKDQTSALEYEDFLKELESKQLQGFKEALWEEVLNFSGPLKAPSLKEMKRLFDKELKNPKFEELVSKLPVEESTQAATPSES